MSLRLLVVLYCAADGWWKIADFGITSPGSTAQLVTTRSGRGKQGYRAPELLQFVHSHYNKKVDGWSLGCVLFEICTGRKAFYTDIAAYEYARFNPTMEIQFPTWIDEPSRKALAIWITQMLEPDPHKRPSAHELGSRLEELIPLLSLSSQPPLNGHQLIRLSLGTQVPQCPGVLRWEELFAPGSIEQHLRMLKQYEHTIASREVVLGETHPYTTWNILRYAWSLFYLDRHDNAVEVFEKVVTIKTSQLGPEHRETLAAQQGLAWTYLHVKRAKKKSTDLFNGIVEVQKKLSRWEETDTMSALQGLAVSALRSGNYGRATELAQSAMEVQMRLLGRESSDTLLSMSMLARVLLETARTAEAAQMYDEINEIQIKALGIDHVDTMDDLYQRAQAYGRLGKHEKAAAFYEQLLPVQSGVLGWHDPLTNDTVKRLVAEYKAMGKTAKAAQLREQHKNAPRVLIGDS